GVELKKNVKKFLEAKGYSLKDVGNNDGESVDYPDIIHPLAKEISENKESKGIIMCGTGNGVSMVANKYKGVRAGLCWSKEIAELIRKHNNANVLSLPARFISTENALEIVKVFLETHFEEGGRHERRVAKIDK
ncbi:RpiB/LacA/LacB family sugar-phosphate isomerase, partial [Flavobacteriales bacterium]|nr:RpiB/LacA/LacB family sugar-phosphate isomerase [Flavobacteriales bacterium]